MVVMTPREPRESWTDERLDELSNRMDEGFQNLRADLRQKSKEDSAEFAALRSQLTSESTALQKEFADVREALGEQRAETKGQIARIDTRLDGLTRAMQIWCWLIVSFLVGLMGMFAAQL